MRILTLALCLTFAACGGGSDAARDEAAAEEKEGVFDPLVGTIDKAKAVEQQVLDQKEQLDKAINDSDGSESENDSDD